MLKSFTGSQDYANTSTLVFPTEELYHIIASLTQQRRLNLEFEEVGGGGWRKRQAEFRLFGVYL